MTKLQNAEDAVEQAIEGGYLGGKPFAHYRKSSHQIVYQEEDYVLPKLTKTILEAMSDPLFWQALGKVRGWEKVERQVGKPYVIKDALGRPEKIGRGWTETVEPEIYYAHCWFDTRQSNGSEDKFFQSLP